MQSSPRTSSADPAAGGTRDGANYGERVQPLAALGLGKGQGASLSVVWIPKSRNEQIPSRTARLVIYELGGKPLAEREVHIAPFSGAAIRVETPARGRRRSVFGYVFIDQPPDGMFAGLEIYDVSSGRTRLAIPVGNG